MRFGIGEKTDHTLEEVGQDFNLTRERISQITQDELMDPGLSQLRQPILDEGERLGEVLVVVDQRRVETLIKHNLRRQLWIYGGIILFLAGVIFGVFLRYVLSPVLRLLDGVNQVSQGNYQLQLPVKGNDELTHLARALNDSAQSIQERFAQQQAYSASQAERFLAIARSRDLSEIRYLLTPTLNEFQQAMVPWLMSGQIKYKEDKVSGLENAATAFIGLLQGENFGKLVLKVDHKG